MKNLSIVLIFSIITYFFLRFIKNILMERRNKSINKLIQKYSFQDFEIEKFKKEAHKTFGALLIMFFPIFFALSVAIFLLIKDFLSFNFYESILLILAYLGIILSISSYLDLNELNKIAKNLKSKS